MGHLKPNPITGVPYLPPEQRGPDGYMNRLGLDKESRSAIFIARNEATYIMDDESGIYHLTHVDIPDIFTSSDSSISGSGKAELNIDDIDGPTLLENTRELDFHFSVQKTNMKPGTSYGSYDEYDVEFSNFSFSQTIALSQATLSKLEMKIKENIISKVRIGHVHKNGE